MVTAPDSQHHLKRSRVWPPPIQPAPRHHTLVQGKRFMQKQGTGLTSITLSAAKATPLWLSLKALPSCRDDSASISLSGVQNCPAFAGLGAQVQQGKELAQTRGRVQQRAFVAQGHAQHAGPWSRRADTGGAAAPGQGSGASHSVSETQRSSSTSCTTGQDIRGR